jgi:uncharacterized RDD family membrane protein YckC
MGSPIVTVINSRGQKAVISERYHTFWERFWAGCVDALVLAPIGLSDNYVSRPGRPEAVLITWAIFSSFVVLGYSIFMHTRYGQTVGKMVLGVKVWDVSESRLPSLKQAFLRDIGSVVPRVAALGYFVFLVISQRFVSLDQVHKLPGVIVNWVDFWFLVEVITMLTNEKRRALHDFIAGTVVCID